MRYFKARSEDIANGPGIRTSIWLCGCSRHCKGCFNQQLADFNAGKLLTPQAMKKFVHLGVSNKEVVGFSILGGEPLEQNVDEMMAFMKMLRDTNKTIWIWTGYVYEELTAEQKRIVSMSDVLVDGPFIQEKRNPKLQFRGSSNQRIIDVKTSIKCGKVILNTLFS